MSAGTDERSRMEGLNDWRKQSGITCSFVIFAGLNIGMMYVGICAVDKCPVEQMIPNYLIVAGSTSLSLLVVRLIVSHILVPRLEQASDEDGLITDPENNEGTSNGNGSLGEQRSSQKRALDFVLGSLRVFDSLASIFSTCWLIVGSIYVYGSHPTYKSISDPSYCDYTAYMFAFVVITIGYVSLGLSIVAAILACFCRKQQQQQEQ